MGRYYPTVIVQALIFDRAARCARLAGSIHPGLQGLRIPLYLKVYVMGEGF